MLLWPLATNYKSLSECLSSNCKVPFRMVLTVLLERHSSSKLIQHACKIGQIARDDTGQDSQLQTAANEIVAHCECPANLICHVARVSISPTKVSTVCFARYFLKTALWQDTCNNRVICMTLPYHKLTTMDHCEINHKIFKRKQ